MPRVIVTTGEVRPDIGEAVLLDEHVASVHLSDGHAAAQLVERLAWAVGDAERVEQAATPRPRATPKPAAAIARSRARSRSRGEAADRPRPHTGVRIAA